MHGHTLVVQLSRESVKSSWCQEDLRMSLAIQIHGKPIKVLPVLLEGCDISGFLRVKAYADFRNEWQFEHGIEDVCDAMVN